mmetsp:Transcript_40711/g.53402  ORF Transcript_40711/g.53402 Transcript_40711/m.53402 type:complete len:164 (+) Transcript_40711:3-494(+)
MQLSAGTASPEASPKKERREIQVYKSIHGKRKHIDWRRMQYSTQDIRPERLDQEGPFEYLIEWDDGEMSWELVENLLNIKEEVRRYDSWLMDNERKARQANNRIEHMRKRSRKALSKGSFEKGHKIQAVVGLCRNKYDNELMCRVRWHPISSGVTAASTVYQV